MVDNVYMCVVDERVEKKKRSETTGTFNFCESHTGFACSK